MNRCSINVWIGNFGTYAVPDYVVGQAKKINAGKSLTDRRTKGYKMLMLWGLLRDKLGKYINEQG